MPGPDDLVEVYLSNIFKAMVLQTRKDKKAI